MAEVRKVLGQLDPLAATATTLYTVPGATQAVVSTITVANRSATATSYRVWIAVAGAADANKQYLAFDVPIAGNEAHGLTEGYTLGAADLIRVQATLATLSFSAFGVELT